MKRAERKRYWKAWLLLLVYLPMTIAIPLHHLGDAGQDEPAFYCQECTQHAHPDGHFLPQQNAMHECVLCQMQSITYTVPTLLTWTAAVEHRPITHILLCLQCTQRALDVKSCRAPPYSLYIYKPPINGQTSGIWPHQTYGCRCPDCVFYHIYI